MYERGNKEWTRYQRQLQPYITRVGCSFYNQSKKCKTPSIKRLVRTVPYQERDGWRATGSCADCREEEDLGGMTKGDLYTSFINYIKNLGTESWAVRSVIATDSIDGIVQSLKDGTAIGVSDGSFKSRFGTACYIIENETGDERIVGLIDVPGFSDEHDAYRSELAGLLGLVMVTDILTKLGDVDEGGLN